VELSITCDRDIPPGGFINGDISNTDLTVSNAQSNYTGQYMCRLCYSAGCTNSSTIELRVLGTREFCFVNIS